MKFVEPFKTQLVAALRSGEYNQAFETLHIPNTNQYCCLGVACKLFNPDGYDIDGDFCYENEERCSDLPTTVIREITDGVGDDNREREFLLDEDQKQEAFRLFEENGIGYEGDKYLSLACLNDFGLNFNQIADFIEEHC